MPFNADSMLAVNAGGEFDMQVQTGFGNSHHVRYAAQILAPSRS